MKTTPFDKILANSCPTHVLTEGDKDLNRVGQVAEYFIETHCVGWTVTAVLTDARELTPGEWFYAYDVLKMEAEDV